MAKPLLYQPDPTPVERLFSPLIRFTRIQASSGILLFLAAVSALVWANLPWGESYHRLWNTEVGFHLGAWGLSKPLLLWVNDALMAVFFFTVGLEIKRELLVGELAEPRQALLPIAAAVGGMVVPATIFFLLNPSGPTARGWGIPMGTDIAFALGVLVLLGKRAPVSLKVFLTAVAIADDLGAIVIIALFYTAGVDWNALGLAFGLLGVMIGANVLAVRAPLIYWLLGVAMWFCFLKSGVHATVGGVLAALAIPASTRLDCGQFLVTAREILDRFQERWQQGSCGILANPRLQSYVDSLQLASLHAEPPLQRLEHAHHPWVAFLIMPIFALANSGVELAEMTPAAMLDPLSLGIVLGLVLGKQVGVTLACWLVVRTGLAALPPDVRWRQLHGVACLCGIGFTMSIFIATLALDTPELLNQAKLAVFGASLISGIMGWLLLRRG